MQAFMLSSAGRLARQSQMSTAFTYRQLLSRQRAVGHSWCGLIEDDKSGSHFVLYWRTGKDEVELYDGMMNSHLRICMMVEVIEEERLRDVVLRVRLWSCITSLVTIAELYCLFMLIFYKIAVSSY